MPGQVEVMEQPAKVCRMSFEGFGIHVEEDFGTATVVGAPLVDVVGVLHVEELS